MAQELPMIPDPHSLHVTGSFGRIRPPPKQSSNQINKWSFYQIFRISSYPAQTTSPPTDDFLSTVRDQQFVSFLPRRIEDSATVLWVHLSKQCDFIKTFFQRESNVWNSGMLGFFFKWTNFSKKRILFFGFHDINTKPKNASLRNLVERPSDCRVRWTKEQPNQEIYRKIGRLQFCSFHKVSRDDFSNVEINRDVCGTCFYF